MAAYFQVVNQLRLIRVEGFWGAGGIADPKTILINIAHNSTVCADDEKRISIWLYDTRNPFVVEGTLDSFLKLLETK